MSEKTKGEQLREELLMNPKNLTETMSEEELKAAYDFCEGYKTFLDAAKHGFSPDECRELLYNLLPEALPYIRICGLMGMATNTDDTSLIKNEFHNIHELFTELKNSVFKGDEYFCELSMGMSHDYPIAIREGSTMIRIGTSIFGEREY